MKAAPVMLKIDPAKLHHTSITASAGSGKTYGLTTRYLQLIAQGVAPSHILASTFTRLAAGEIRDRILKRLADAICCEKDRHQLQQELGVTSLPVQDLHAMLAGLARRIDQMQIRTLDSFFASVVRAFAIELDLPIGSEVVDESQAQRMRVEAMRLMLDESNPQKLIDLLRDVTRGDSRRSVMQAIDGAVKDIHALFREAASDQAWECVAEAPGRLTPSQVVAATQRLNESAFAPDQRTHDAHRQACEAATAWRWADFLGCGLSKAVLNETFTYHRKPIPASVIDCYRPLVRHATAEVIGRIRSQNVATRDLLKSFDAHYTALKHRMRAITFDDLTAAMIKASGSDIVYEIGYRLDAKLHHVLLDEFQDTSIPQWRALEPIALELTANEPPQRTFFCVGDVKQSIYGWRSAAPEIMDGLPHRLPGITQDSLTASWRSSPEVIEAVNHVFESLETNTAVQGFGPAVDLWKASFARHSTHKTKLAGRVELRTMRAPVDDESKPSVRYAAAAQLAVDLNRQNPSLSIGILTRTNSAVAAIMYELGPSRRNIPGGVSGRGGGPLHDVPAVNAILDLLQLADHPDDTSAAFHVANTPLGFAIGLDDHRDQHKRHRIARAVRRELLEEGYSRTIGAWVAAIAGACDGRELRRALQLVELASMYDETRTLRTSDFIELVESTDVADVQPAAVQVMTVHQSKGLEFDAVILPELEGQLTGSKTSKVVYARDEPTGPITSICTYMAEDIRGLIPDIQPVFDNQQRRTVRESLSVLYVAMTRARCGLYMLIDPTARTKAGGWSTRSLKTPAGMLRCALATCDPEPNQILYEHGGENWMIGFDGERAAASPSGESVIDLQLKALPKGVRPRAVVATAASHLTAAGSARLDQQLCLTSPEARERGIALHTLFEQIGWIEDFVVEKAALAKIVRARFPRRDEQWVAAQVRAFLAALTNDGVKHALSRGDHAPDRLRLHREFPFVRQTEHGLQSGMIDRLVVEVDERCNPIAATIIDFKTDALDVGGGSTLRVDYHDAERRATIATYAERYRPQMETYRAAAAPMLGIRPEAVSLRLLFIGSGVAADL